MTIKHGYCLHEVIYVVQEELIVLVHTIISGAKETHRHNKMAKLYTDSFNSNVYGFFDCLKQSLYR